MKLNYTLEKNESKIICEFYNIKVEIRFYPFFN